MSVNNYVEDDYAEEGYFESGIDTIWGQARIFIPRSELTLVQSFPSVVYNLDLNEFRLKLKDREDDEEGIVFVDTHNHVAPITVGGVTLARVVEIINSYVIEFEDGQYSVNLINANSNVSDRVVPNQVSVRTANSAGLQIVSTATNVVTGDLADVPAAVWSHLLEGLSAEEIMRVMLAALAGKTSGLGTPTEQYLAQDGVTPRVTATFDENNNRTTVTLNGAA